MFRRVDKRFFSQLDWQLIMLMLVICSIGLALVYSAGFDPVKQQSERFFAQASYMAAGLVVFVCCMFFNTSFWRRTAFLFYAAGCLLLVLVLLNGTVVNGARRWLDLGGVRIQPSEFAKLGTILVLAYVFSSENAPRGRYTLLKMAWPIILMIIPTLLVLRQPDLGTALSYLLVGGSMLLLAGLEWKTLIGLVILGFALVVPAWEFLLQDYQRHRILTFMSPEADPLGKGYHALQSKIAVGSGALFGKGFLQGTQSQLRFLPEQTTDFIFSVLAEEWGFVGSLMVVALYGLLIQRLLSITSRCAEAFPAFVSFGVAALLFWHTLINIGMVIGIMPVVGITLTLTSYGGSSIITMMAGLGIVSGFSIRRFLFS